MKASLSSIQLCAKSEFTINQKKKTSCSFEKPIENQENFKSRMDFVGIGSPYESDDFILEEIQDSDKQIGNQKSGKFLENQLIKKSELNGQNINIFYSNSKKKSTSRTFTKQSFESQYSILGKLTVDFHQVLLQCKKFMSNQIKFAKIYQNPENETNGHIQCELEILNLLTKYPSKQLAKLEQIIYQSDKLIVITEGCQGITLKQLIQSQYQLKLEEIQKIIKSILKGIRHMHGLGIVHRHINPDIIVFLEKGNYRKLKIANFTFAKKFEFDQSYNMPYLNFYQALELKDEFCVLDESVDIYSVGIILTQLLLKEKFEESSKKYNLQTQNEQFYEEIVKSLQTLDSQVSKNLILQMISANPQKRPSAIECLNHLFFCLQPLEDESIFSDNERIQSPCFPQFKNPFIQ